MKFRIFYRVFLAVKTVKWAQVTLIYPAILISRLVYNSYIKPNFWHLISIHQDFKALFQFESIESQQYLDWQMKIPHFWCEKTKIWQRLNVPLPEIGPLYNLHWHRKSDRLVQDKKPLFIPIGSCTVIRTGSTQDAPKERSSPKVVSVDTAISRVST